MDKNQTEELLKLLNECLAEAHQSESPQRLALLKALAPMAVSGLDFAAMQPGSAGVAARRLLFEVLGLVGKGQKSTPASKDPTA